MIFGVRVKIPNKNLEHIPSQVYFYSDPKYLTGRGHQGRRAGRRRES